MAHDLRYDGQPEEAKALAERALAIQAASLEPDHPEIAATTYQLGQALLELRDAKAALPHLERTVALFEAQDGVQETEPEARHALARALVESGGDEARAIAEAERAVTEYESFGEAGRKGAEEARAWLAQHR